MSEHETADLTAEAEGGSLGEAKWNAVKLLEPRFPGVTADCVSFEVLDEGDEDAGVPARVRAEVDEEAFERVAHEIPDSPAERVRAIVSRVVAALGLRASVDIDESDEEIRATVNGDDLGLLIGRHGATIDALQHLAMRAAFHSSADHKAVVVDAAGYRERREGALKRAADRAVEDALSFGRAVELEPMSPQERRIVHVYLRDRTDVQTHSEGDEPDRRLVVTPVQPRG
ncbi:MAG TPA: R3H domain-containing nucleic acid-binding protein [Myxococcales bacterium]|jgi:spoIIIJ-associated protein|nr:R3H domain-containing nucleic acid-binding protein [Myxococcales bacterium]